MRHALSTQICAVLLALCLILFATGYAVMSAMQEENLKVLYSQSVDLVAATLSVLDSELSDIKDIAYEVIVSDHVQSAVSAYLDAQDQGTLSSQAHQLDLIGNTVSQQIFESPLITCANLIDARSSVRVIASRSYRRLTGQEAEEMTAVACQAQGATLLLEDPQRENGLLVVKQLRERRNLSMRHAGVLVLFVDLLSMEKTLLSRHVGFQAIRMEIGDLQFMLPAGGFGDLFEAPEKSPEYAVRRQDGRNFFVVHVPGRTLSATFALDYNALFSANHSMFVRYIWIFVAVTVIALVLALIFVRRAASGFQRLIRHISHISGHDPEVIPLLSDEAIGSRDAHELCAAFNNMALRVNQLVDENYRKQLMITETQLCALQAQINPHFIYNTLNAIYWEAKEQNNTRAAGMTEALSHLLREAVSIHETLVTIDRELEIVRNYLRIQKLRFGSHLQICFDISEDVSQVAVPKFSIQVLLENAISHGADQMLGPCEINVEIHRDGNVCICEVLNTGPAPLENLMDKLRAGEGHGEGSGIGLLNMEKRMQALLGPDSLLEIGRRGDRTFARMTFRCRELDEKD